MSLIEQWERDGTLLTPSGTEIDLRCTLPSGDDDWITIKGSSDARSEALAERVLLLLNSFGMSAHDRVRMEKALLCDRNNLDSLADAVRGLQSTDDPRLLTLHDELLTRFNELEGAHESKRFKRGTGRT